jgi:hypothetical protein
VGQRPLRVEFDQVEGDVDYALTRHGLRGVGAEVHDHLLHPARFAQRDDFRIWQGRPKGDGWGQGGIQKADGLLEQRAHPYRTVPVLAAAAEG